MNAPSPLPAAVLLGIDCITGLQTARTLHDFGAPVVGLAHDATSPYCATRAVRLVRSLPGPDDALADALADLPIPPNRPALVVPCTDDQVRRLSQERNSLPDRFRFALPDQALLDRLTDKTQSAFFAEQAGLAIPRTRLIRTLAEADAAAGDLRYPCVLKPAIRTREWLDRMNRKVFQVSSPGQLLERTAAWLPHPDPLVLQEWIEGGDSDMYSLYAYLNRECSPLAGLVARKIRQWPVETGVGTLSVVVDEPEVLADGLRFLRTAGCRGLANIQYKRDPRDGRFYFVEVNAGRPALGMPIAEAAGLRFFQTFYSDVMGLPLPSERSVVQVGAKWICWKTDLASAWTYWRRGELSLADWWRSIQGIRRCALFSPSDPAPFFLDMVRKARGRLRP